MIIPNNFNNNSQIFNFHHNYGFCFLLRILLCLRYKKYDIKSKTETSYKLDSRPSLETVTTRDSQPRPTVFHLEIQINKYKLFVSKYRCFWKNHF